MSQTVSVNPTKKISGDISIPPDKSLTHRSLILSSMATGRSTIKNPLEAADCLSTLQCLKDLGVQIEKNKSQWTVHGVGRQGFKKPLSPLNCGNSGTTMRLLSGVLATQNFESLLEGDASLSKRPMVRVANLLKEFGAQFKLTNEKYAPIRIKGTSQPKPIQWSNPVASAQVKSAFLLASLSAKGVSQYSEPTISRDHTERMLMFCGVKLSKKGRAIEIEGPVNLSAQNWIIPSDISSAAFFIVAGLLIEGSQVKLRRINLNPTRTGILDVIKIAGGKIEISNESTISGEPIGDVTIRGKQKLGPLKIDKEISARLIDEVPILAVLATQSQGRSHFSGLGELRVKESDRLGALALTLKSIGANIEELDDGLIVQGPTPLKGGVVSSFGDHRMAMALGIAGLISQGPVTVEGSECVDISFPSFWDTLRKQ